MTAAVARSSHQAEVLLTFFEQLVLPYFLLIPLRPARLLGALGELLFLSLIHI